MLTVSALRGRAVRILIAASAILFTQAALSSEAASAKNRTKGELHCLATAIYFEARGESERGQRAVAEVVLARTKSGSYPKTICGVVYEGSSGRYCQFSFACDRHSEVVRDTKCWTRAQRIAADTIASRNRIVPGAIYFHVKSIHPRWASHMVRVARIGTHIFYRPRHTARV